MRSFRSWPVRARLTAWYVGLLAAALLLYISITSGVLYFQLYQQLTRSAIQEVETVEGLLAFDHGRLVLNQNYHNHPQSRQVLDWLLEVLAPDGKILLKNERLGNQALGGLPFRGEGVNGYSPRTVRLADGRYVILVSRRHIVAGQPILIRLAYLQTGIGTRIEDFLTASIIALPLLLAIAGLFGYQLARRSLSPLEVMAARAERITVEQLDQRLPVSNPDDELGYLARVFNNMLDRLHQSFERLRRFTSDASHELRTPLAAIRTVGEVGLHKNQTCAQYRETVGSMLEEVARLTKLIDNLLAISRADAGHVAVNLSVFPALELATEVVSIVNVLAEERQQNITIAGDTTVQIRADRTLLQQALLNLLDNAIKYSPIGGDINVSVTRNGNSFASLKIADSGPGIPAEHREKIFDRFYRIDAARSRDTGGTGLGLAIAHWAVQVQGGRIHVEDNGHGSAFSIDLPTTGA